MPGILKDGNELKQTLQAQNATKETQNLENCIEDNFEQFRPLVMN